MNMKLPLALSCLLAISTTTITPASAAAAADDERLTTFPLPSRPEGITNGPNSTLLVSQILSGKVLSIDALTGETKEVVGEQPLGLRQAWGLWYYDGAIFVGGGGPPFGGGTPQIYVYNATDGTQLATCDPLSTNDDLGMTFMNDVTVVGNKAYATDSFNNKLMVFDADEAINNGKCIVSEVTLPDAFRAKTDEDWGANGLVEYADGLLVVHETGGSVYHIGDLDSGDDSPTFQEVILAGGAVTGDGLNVVDDKLYITMNYENKIGVFQLGVESDGGNITATPLDDITSPDYQTPATSALYCGYIYSANSLFATHEISDAANDTVVGVYAYDDPSCVVESSDETKPPTAVPTPGTDAPTPQEEPTPAMPTPEAQEPSSGFVSKYSHGVMIAIMATVCIFC